MHSTSGLADETGPGRTAAELELRLRTWPDSKLARLNANQACLATATWDRKACEAKSLPQLTPFLLHAWQRVWRGNSRQTPTVCCGGIEQMCRPCCSTDQMTSSILGGASSSRVLICFACLLEAVRNSVSSLMCISRDAEGTLMVWDLQERRPVFSQR